MTKYLKQDEIDNTTILKIANDLKEGKLVVKTGPDGDMNYDILRPEYKEENLKDKMLYRGIEQFKEDRCKRDFFWGEEKVDDNF